MRNPFIMGCPACGVIPNHTEERPKTALRMTVLEGKEDGQGGEVVLCEECGVMYVILDRHREEDLVQ